MMTSLLFLWSSVIPEIPLMLAHRNVISIGTIGLLIVSVVGLWLERDRRRSTSKPVDFSDDHERLAA